MRAPLTLILCAWLGCTLIPRLLPAQEKSTVAANKPEPAQPTAETKTPLNPSATGDTQAKSTPAAKETPATPAAKSAPADKSDDKKSADTKGTEKPSDDKAKSEPTKDDAKKTESSTPKPDAEPKKKPVETPPVEKRLTFFEQMTHLEAKSPEKPELPFWPCDADHQQLITDGYNYARRLDIITRILKDRHKNEKLLDLSISDISSTHIMNIWLGRIVERLQILREPAAADLNAHHLQFTAIINFIVKEYTALPNFPQEKIRMEVEKLQKALLEKEKPKIVKMIDAKQYLAADEALDRVFDKLESLAVWLGDRSRYLLPFQQLRQIYRIRLVEESRKKAAADWKLEQAKIPQDGFDLLTKLQAASNPLSSGSTTDWRGKALTGPQLVTTVLQEWQHTMPELCQVAGYVSLMVSPNPAENTGITTAEALIGPTKDYGKYYPEVCKALAVVVEKDALDCSADDAPQLYIDYVLSLAAVQAHINETISHFDRPLDALAKKNEAFYQDLNKYRSITAPVLSYRSAWSTAMHTAQSEDTPLVGEAFRRTFFEQKGGGTGFVRNNSTGVFFTYDPALPTLRRRAHRLLLQPVSVPNVVFDPASPENYLAPLNDSCYGIIAVPKKKAGLQKQIDALRADLLVSETSPPLTLVAATALWKAEHSFWLHVGADVENFYLDAAQSLQLKVSPNERYFTALNQLPLPSDLGQLTFRYRCSEPYWIHHEYFFCDLNVE
jgi:hypothetical protein